MSRWITLTLLAVGLVAGGFPPLAIAQEASPVASPASAARLDLAALVLLPRDLDESGVRAGAGGYQSPEEEAAFHAAQSGIPAAEISATLREAGSLRRYSLALELPMPAGDATPGVAPDLVRTRIVTSITEYATAEGAAAGFAYIDGELEDLTDAEDLALPELFGDESELTRSSHVTTDTNLPYQELNLTFRDGNLVADVVVQDLLNEEADPALVLGLAEKLQGKIAEGQGGGDPGLSNLIIRAVGPTETDSYVAIGGTAVPAFVESLDEIAARQQAYADAGMSAVYSLEQTLGEWPYLTARLYQFATTADASAWLTEQPAPSLPSPPYVEVEEAANTPEIGEEARAFAYSYPVSASNKARGYAVFFRHGSIIARVQVDSVPRAPLAAVLELAEAQAACLDAGRCLEPVPIPAALSASTPTPIATPAATPVG